MVNFTVGAGTGTPSEADAQPEGLEVVGWPPVRREGVTLWAEAPRLSLPQDLGLAPSRPRPSVPGFLCSTRGRTANADTDVRAPIDSNWTVRQSPWPGTPTSQILLLPKAPGQLPPTPKPQLPPLRNGCSLTGDILRTTLASFYYISN